MKLLYLAFLTFLTVFASGGKASPAPRDLGNGEVSGEVSGKVNNGCDIRLCTRATL